MPASSHANNWRKTVPPLALTHRGYWSWRQSVPYVALFVKNTIVFVKKTTVFVLSLGK